LKATKKEYQESKEGYQERKEGTREVEGRKGKRKECRNKGTKEGWMEGSKEGSYVCHVLSHHAFQRTGVPI
jgi:hypothetical protein